MTNQLEVSMSMTHIFLEQLTGNTRKNKALVSRKGRVSRYFFLLVEKKKTAKKALSRIMVHVMGPG